MLPKNPDTGRTKSVTLAYDADPTFTPNMARWWGEQIPNTKFWDAGNKIVAEVSTDNLPTSNDARRLELKKLVDSWLRDQVKKIGGTLPKPSFDPIDLDGATPISATDGKLKAADLPGFKPSIAIPFLSGKNMRKVPERKPFVFKGAIRRQDVAAIVAKSKHRKSFLVAQSAACFAAKRPFLGLEPGDGRVLLVDLELHQEDTIARLHRQAKALGIKWADLEDNLDIVNLRGIPMDIYGLRDYILDDLADRPYSYIIIDTLYRLLPKGVSENDANGITGVLNIVAEIGRERDAAIEIVAHAPKGDTKNRAIEDLTSGTGAFGRFIDAQWGLYTHSEPLCMVLKTMLRADKTPPDIVVRFDEEGLIFVPEPGLSPRALAASGDQPNLRVDDVLKHLPKDYVKKGAFVSEMQGKLAASKRIVEQLIESGIVSGQIELLKTRGPVPAQLRLKQQPKKRKSKAA